jgi:pimeloyl-ACP methyl ester carboxylesterase
LTLTSLGDDAAIVSCALNQLDEPAVLVGHSSGGLVISRAAAGPDDVRHLVYPAGVMMGSAGNFFAAAGDFPVTPLGRRMSITNGIITIDPDVAVACLYNECATTDAVAAAGRLRPAALACLTEPAGAEPWRGIRRRTSVVSMTGRSIPRCSKRCRSMRRGRSPWTLTIHRSCQGPESSTRS